MLPILIELILKNLASEHEDNRSIASRTLGDLAKKLGERILPKLMPILEKGLKTGSDEQRQGVCIGLSEVISAASKDMVAVMAPDVGPIIKVALADSTESVRQQAAATFDVLHNKLGSQVRIIKNYFYFIFPKRLWRKSSLIWSVCLIRQEMSAHMLLMASEKFSFRRVAQFFQLSCRNLHRNLSIVELSLHLPLLQESIWVDTSIK